MARNFNHGEKVRVIGGIYKGKCGVVVKHTPMFVYIQYEDTGAIKRSQRKYCGYAEAAAPEAQHRQRPPVGPRLTALIKATAAVVGEAGVDIEEAVLLFAAAVEKAAF